jgi:protease PrsW
VGKLVHLSGLASGVEWHFVPGSTTTIGAGQAVEPDYRLTTRRAPLVLRLTSRGTAADLILLANEGDAVLINGTELLLDEPVQLQPHDILLIDSVRMMWLGTAGVDAQAPPRRAFPPGCQMILEGPGSPVAVMSDLLMIGRDPANELCVPDDPKIARRHARLFKRDGDWHLFDLESSTGTFLNDKPLTKPTLLHDGDLIRCGDTAWKVALPEPATSHAAPAPPPQSSDSVDDLGIDDEYDLVLARQSLGKGDLSLMNPFFVLSRDKPWKRFSGRWALFLGIAPFLAMMSEFADPAGYAWIIAIYFGLLWLAVLRPVFGPIEVRPSRLIPALFLMPFLISGHLRTMAWEPMQRLSGGGEDGTALIKWILGTGVPEEFWKALPLLMVFFAARRAKVGETMYLGLILGLSFGIWEAALYVENYADAVTSTEDLAPFLAITVLRVVSLPLLHGMWTAIVGYFIGVGAKIGEGAQVLAVLGLTLSAILHGLYNWSTSATMLLACVTVAFTILLFVSYARSSRFMEDLDALEPRRSRSPRGTSPPARQHDRSSAGIR